MCISIREWCLKVTLPNLTAAAGVLNVNLEKINIYTYTVKKMQCYFTFYYSVSILEHLQT